MKLTEIIIIETIADYFEVTTDDLKSNNREQLLVKARHLIFYFCREKTNLPLKFIGGLLNRDHASVMHGIKSVNNQVETDKKYRVQFDRLAEIMKNLSDRERDEEYFMENDYYPLAEPIEVIKPIVIKPKVIKIELLPVKIESILEKPEKKQDKEPVYINPFANIPAERHEYKSYCKI